MIRRWRGRSAGFAILILLTLPLVALAASRGDRTLVVRGPDDDVLAVVELPDGTFRLSYRNSIYRSVAEESYRVSDSGQIVLETLAADELAVLEEYYAIDEPARRTSSGARAWVADPARPVVLDELIVAATDLGRRTLLVRGEEPLELWQLVDDSSPSVRLEVGPP